MCFLQLIADPLEAQVAGSTIAFDVGHTSDLVSMVHVALVNAIRGTQELAAIFTGCGHFL